MTETITEKDVKRLWIEKDAVCIELNDGRIGREFFRDYEPLRKATKNQLKKCRLCPKTWHSTAAICSLCKRLQKTVRSSF